ncbi:MAG: formate/nitrite transporter family protein [Clostridia bacterium]|nr:formate/nitrite transporter family protein [Clostridia bacterium]
MKPFEKMTRLEVAVFCLMSICSGLMIGIGGSASLLANSLFDKWGRLIGAMLFSIGIYAIVMYEMRLFTGMVAAIPKMGLKNTWRLLVCFIGNTLGVAIIAGLVYFTPLADTIIPRAKSLISAKLEMDNWAMSSLCSSILCGSLITLSVWSVKYAPKKSLSATLGVTFPIVVFAFCGFDHSVANMLYFIFLGKISWQIVGYCLLSVLGNIIGGIILPLISLLREKSKQQ